MSDPAYVVMPVRADGSPAQQNERQGEVARIGRYLSPQLTYLCLVAAAIQESLHEKIHTAEHDQDPKPDPEARPEQDGGPLKRVMCRTSNQRRVMICWVSH